jgi:hypothetical protein
MNDKPTTMGGTQPARRRRVRSLGRHGTSARFSLSRDAKAESVAAAKGTARSGAIRSSPMSFSYRAS